MWIFSRRKPDVQFDRVPASKGSLADLAWEGNNPRKGVSYSKRQRETSSGFQKLTVLKSINTAAFCSHIPNPVGGVAWWFKQSLSWRRQNLKVKALPEDMISGTNV